VTVRLSVTSHLLTLNDMRTLKLCLTHTHIYTLQYTILHCITLHCIELRYLTLYYITFTTLHYTTVHYMHSIFIHSFIHSFIHTYIQTYITYIHTIIHTYTYLYTYTRTLFPPPLSLFNVLEQRTVCPRAFWCSPERCRAHENFKISRILS